MSKASTVEPAGLSSNGKPITTKSEPKHGIHISKRAMLLLAIPAALAGGVVVYNIFSRGDAPALAHNDKPKTVESAMDVAESINQKAERPVAFSLPVAAPTDATPATTQPAGAGAAPQLPNTAAVNEAPKTLTLAEQAAQRLADERLQRLQQAMDAATKTKSFREGEGGIGAGNNPAGGGMNPSSNPYAALASAGFNPASLLGAGGMGKDDPNGQKDK
ncbi:MAG: hypothetical protein B7Z82_09410, partial [Halothiobacillus sp. 20-54-6]